jgi:bifunctional ADP-heptose synthase (sugar kinase/adenylyltransferase)
MHESELPEFDGAKILVAGDVMLDRYWFGEIERISPEAPVPVLKVQRVEERPDGASNVARNIAALGARATLLSVVGTDEAGKPVLIDPKGDDYQRYRGATLLTPNLNEFREVFDVSGAGDTVIATLAVMLASGADLPDAMRVANRAAGIVVAKLGTASVTREEIVQDMQLTADGTKS